MNDDEKRLKALHVFGLKGIINVLKKKGTFKKWPLKTASFTSVALAVLIAFFLTDKAFEILKNTADIIMSFFPNLLGFSLGGYALVVGFGNTALIKSATKTDKHSTYQILNAIFSLSIFMQVFTTIICFITVWLIKIDVTSLTGLYIKPLADLINAVVFFLLLFGSLYSILLTPYVITNLFTFSQMNNLFLTVEKIRDDKGKLPVKEVEEPNS